MRAYYNQRVGGAAEPPRLTLVEASRQLVACYDDLVAQGYLQKAFGYHCVDAGSVPGEHGADIRTHFYLRTCIRIDLGIPDFLETTDAVGLFTLIEFLHDHVAKPDERSGRFHSFGGCGWHFDRRDGRFDVHAARREWRDKVNSFLHFYEEGYELSADGEIARLAPDGLSELLAADIPVAAGDVNTAKLKNAVRTFRRGLSTREERKQAVRELVDLLEFYRSQIKIHLLPKDEADLFNIANNFAIRHHRSDQKDQYGDSWLSWMFCVYLASVHLLLELIHGPTERASVEHLGAGTRSEPTEQGDDDILF